MDESAGAEVNANERIVGLVGLIIVALASIGAATALSIHDHGDTAAWLTLAGSATGGVAGYVTGRSSTPPT